MLASALGALSCATTPMARAIEAERLQCDATTLDATALVGRLSVLSVSPLYVQIHSSTVAEVRTRGAKLLVRPPDGVDPYRLVRSLQCHAARTLLGREGPVDPNDPFSLPWRWLQIDVQSESGNYLVSILADSVSEGMEVLGRARAFARDHGPSVNVLLGVRFDEGHREGRMSDDHFEATEKLDRVARSSSSRFVWKQLLRARQKQDLGLLDSLRAGAVLR